MPLDVRTAQTTLENLLRDVILQALGVRLPSVSSVAALRAIQSTGPSGTFMRNDDDLAVVVTSGVASYRWNSVSASADDGVNVIKPNDAAANGRWLLWTTPVRFVPSIGANSTTLDQMTTGPLARVIVVDKAFSPEELKSLIVGQTPAVIIECTGDDPEDATLDVGHRWINEYSFTVYVVAENVRDRREASQGSQVPGDSASGANAIDGLIQTLISGTVLNAAIATAPDQPIQNVRKGRGRTETSELLERYVFRARDYTIQVSEEFPAAPNDTNRITDVYTQAQLVDLHQQASFDPNNYLVSGINPVVGGALTQTLPAGSAVIAGATVNYAGGSVTFPTYSDTYRDLNPNGTLTLTSVGANGVPPAPIAGALRIGFTTTSGTVVLADTLIAETKANFGPDFDFPI